MDIKSFDHIVAAVCTRQRPAMLKDCLVTLLQQSLPPSVKLSLLIIENDSEPRTESQVLALQTTTPINIHYRLEPDIGIAQARNRALSEALLLGGDWLWFVDDDEMADKNCLRELMSAAAAFNADAVHGRVLFQYPELPASDQWARLLQQAQRKPFHGKRLYSAATNNILFSSRLFADAGFALRFDPRLRLSGGEDTLFFKRAYQKGAVMVFSEKALVTEKVPAARCSLSYLLLRQASITASGVYVDQEILGPTHAKAKHLRRIRQNLVQLLTGIIASPIMLLRGRRFILSLLMKAATLYGRWRGLRGKLFNSYQVISGN